jgi:NAD(P)-dependent dehydrogenase (short-subunit alcohol dehydrogenase family)
MSGESILSFRDKVAIVTGGGSGIGRAASRRLAQQGAKLVVVDLAADRAEETAALIREAGGEAVALGGNIASEADNAAMFDLAEKTFGGVDLAFLNAGMLQPYMPFEELTTELLDELLDVNLRGTFFGLKQAQARLRPGGACVVTASLAGLLGFSEAAAYSVSKHAVLGLVRSAVRSFANRRLRVNAICPGQVLTPMNGLVQDDRIVDRMDPPEYRGAMSAQQVAEAALLLLSDGAIAINGHAQVVDAAATAAFPPLDL